MGRKGLRQVDLWHSIMGKTEKLTAEPTLNFDGLNEQVGAHLRAAGVEFYRHFQASVSHLGVTQIQVAFLRLINRNDDIAQIDIAHALHIDKATTMTIIKRLFKSGLIDSRKSKIDGRRHVLFLTDEGKRVLEEAKKAIAEHEKTMLSPLNEAEVETLKHLLRRISGHFYEHVPDGQDGFQDPQL